MNVHFYVFCIINTYNLPFTFLFPILHFSTVTVVSNMPSKDNLNRKKILLIQYENVEQF